MGSLKTRATLFKRRFQEFDEFLFRDRMACEDRADGRTRDDNPRLAFKESGQTPPNVACDCSGPTLASQEAVHGCSADRDGHFPFNRH